MPYSLQTLSDRAEIQDVFANFALGLGIPAFDRYIAIFADQVEIRIPHHLGIPVQHMTGAEFGASIEKFQSKFEARFHTQSAHLITIDGDSAHVEALQMFRFVNSTTHGANWYMGGGVLNCDLVRTGQGWKITLLENRVTWDDGNWSIFEQARGPVG
jgi:hypothetical protein